MGMHRWLSLAPALAVAVLVLFACGEGAESAGDPGAERPEAVEEEPTYDLEAPEETAWEAEPAPAAEEPRPRSEVTEGDRPLRDPDPEDLVRTEPEAVVAPGEVEPAPAGAVVSAGTRITLVLDETLSTRDDIQGKSFQARVSEDVLAPDGLVLIPQGARVTGEVAESRQSAGPDDEAVLAVKLHTLMVEDRSHPLHATIVETDVEAGTRDSGARTAAKVATGTAAGAVVGRILGGDRRDALTGAAVGAAAGTAIALTTRDGHATLPAGSRIVIEVDETIALR